MAEVTRRGIVFAGFTHNLGSAKVVKALKTGYKVRVKGLILTAASAVNVTIEENDGTNLSELIQLTATGGLFTVLPLIEKGFYWQTAVSKGLSILLSGGVVTSGLVMYEQIPDIEGA